MHSRVLQKCKVVHLFWTATKLRHTYIVPLNVFSYLSDPLLYDRLHGEHLLTDSWQLHHSASLNLLLFSSPPAAPSNDRRRSRRSSLELLFLSHLSRGYAAPPPPSSSCSCWMFPWPSSDFTKICDTHLRTNILRACASPRTRSRRFAAHPQLLHHHHIQGRFKEDKGKGSHFWVRDLLAVSYSSI